MTHDSHKARLTELIRTLCVRDEVTSAPDPALCLDLEQATLHHEAAPLIGHVMIDLLEESGYAPGDYDSVGGATRSASYVATALLHAATSRGLDLDAFCVCAAAPSPESLPPIEGPSINGRKIVVIDDPYAEGNSPLPALETLRQAQAEIVAVAAVVGGPSRLKDFAEEKGIVYCSALTDLDLVTTAIKN